MLSWLRRLAQRLPYPIFIRLFWMKHRMVELRRHRAKQREGRVRSLAELDLGQYKKSDTVFLLGSGPSINRISAERWQAIAAHDSIGFNFWLVHRFIPTLYAYERIDATHWPALFEAFREVAARRAVDYRNTPKIVSELGPDRRAVSGELPPVWKEMRFTYEPVTLAARTEDEFAYALGLLKKGGVFAPTTRVESLFKYASTLSSLISLAVRLQYKRIVLCGVDLWNQEYFYQDEKLYPECAHLVPEPKSIPHLIVRDFPWLIKLDVVLKQMCRQVLEPAGVELYVEHRGSKLWPGVPEAPADVFALPSALPAADSRDDNSGKPMVK